jgi:hypothetical protein
MNLSLILLKNVLRHDVLSNKLNFDSFFWVKNTNE